MARNYTWGALRTKIRQRTNKEISQFVKDSEIDGMMEESYATLHNILVNLNENYIYKEYQLAIYANTTRFELPVDFFKLKGVTIEDNGYIRRLELVPWERRCHYQQTPPAWGGYPVGYALVGSQIQFFPTSQSNIYVTVGYIPAAPVYISDETVIDGISGFETYIIYSVAALIRAKEEKPASEFLAQRELALQNIRAAATPRDMENAVTITDVLVYDI
jgi:hypothetical protein